MTRRSLIFGSIKAERLLAIDRSADLLTCVRAGARAEVTSAAGDAAFYFY